MYKFNKEEIVDNIALEKYFGDIFDVGHYQYFNTAFTSTKGMTKEQFVRTLIQMVNKQIIELKK